MTKITDPAILAAVRFVKRYHDDLGPLAPDKGSREEQHAILVLSAFIRESDKPGKLATWLRDAHEGEGDECLVPCAEGDPGAFPVYRRPA